MAFAVIWLGAGLLGQLVWQPWLLIPRRLLLWPLGGLFLLPWFLVVGETTRGAGLAGQIGWWLGHSAVLAGGLLLYRLATRYVTLLRDQPEPAIDLSDGQRLQRAFGWTATAVLRQNRQIAGDRASRVVTERFNHYALAAGWRVQAARGEIEDSLAADLGLIERGQVYAFALGLLLDLVAQEVGEKLTVRALQRAYDGLPWEEREIAGQYLRTFDRA